MQDWDTRIKNLKNDIQIAREKYVIPFTNVQPKAPVNTETVKENQNNETNSLQQDDPKPQEKLYIDNDLTSSLNSINTNEESEVTATEEIPTADVNEVAPAEGASTENLNEVAASEEIPTVDVNEVTATEETPTLDINEVAAKEEMSTADVNEVAPAEEASTENINEVVATEDIPTVDVNEVLATAETLTLDANELAATEEVLSKINLEENIQDNLNDTGESQVKKTELELLEERGEDNLSDEEVDRMYELRLLRSQKNMNNELRQQEQEELQKADEEIAHLKTLLKPKPKKLPKGYVE
ncbi:MAG: hypothetical protein ISQ89_05470 [Alphaproteobacteria bacterium]|nr:hypothetical protein [Alphaproteobacteria bacterium]